MPGLNVNKAFAAPRIKLAHHVVEQQQWGDSARLEQSIALSEEQCQECCALLPNPLSDLREGRDPRPEYPSSYTVGLDVGTGVVVALEAVGGDLGYSPDFELEIVEAG